MRVLKRVVRLAERGGVVVGAGDPDAADAAVGAPGSEWRAASDGSDESLPEEEDPIAPLYEREDELFSVALERLGLGPPRASASPAVRFALALSGDDAETARRGFESLTTYLASLHRFGPDVGAALLPLYGAAEFPQAFARLAAVRGATCALRVGRAPRVRRVDQTRTELVRRDRTRRGGRDRSHRGGATSAVSRARRRRRRDDTRSFAGEGEGVAKRKRDARDALDLARRRGGGRRVRFLSERGRGRGSRAGGRRGRRKRRAFEAREKHARGVPARVGPRRARRRGDPRRAARRRDGRLSARSAERRRKRARRVAGAAGVRRVEPPPRLRGGRPAGRARAFGGHQLAARVRGRDAGNAVGGGDGIRRRFRRGKRCGKRRVREGKRNHSARGNSARVVFRAPLATARGVGIVPSRSRARRRANLRGFLVRASEERRDVPRAGRARGLRGPGRRRRGGGCAAVGRRSVEAFFFPRRRRSATTSRRARRTGGPERETRTRTRWTRCFGTYRGG